MEEKIETLRDLCKAYNMAAYISTFNDPGWIELYDYTNLNKSVLKDWRGFCPCPDKFLDHKLSDSRSMVAMVPTSDGLEEWPIVAKGNVPAFAIQECGFELPPNYREAKR